MSHDTHMRDKPPHICQNTTHIRTYGIYMTYIRICMVCIYGLHVMNIPYTRIYVILIAAVETYSCASHACQNMTNIPTTTKKDLSNRHRELSLFLSFLCPPPPAPAVNLFHSNITYHDQAKSHCHTSNHTSRSSMCWSRYPGNAPCQGARWDTCHTLCLCRSHTPTHDTQSQRIRCICDTPEHPHTPRPRGRGGARCHKKHICTPRVKW